MTELELEEQVERCECGGDRDAEICSCGSREANAEVTHDELRGES